MQEILYIAPSKKMKFSAEGRQRQGKNMTTNGYKIAENNVFSKALHQKASREKLWVQKSHVF